MYNYINKKLENSKKKNNRNFFPGVLEPSTGISPKDSCVENLAH